MFETELFNFHKIVVTEMKTSHRKLKPKIVNYRKYKDFSNNGFRKVLVNELFKITFSKIYEEFEIFFWVSCQVLEIFAPRKQQKIVEEMMYLL